MLFPTNRAKRYRGPRKVLRSKLFGERRNKCSKLKRFAREPFSLAKFVWTIGCSRPPFSILFSLFSASTASLVFKSYILISTFYISDEQCSSLRIERSGTGAGVPPSILHSSLFILHCELARTSLPAISPHRPPLPHPVFALRHLILRARVLHFGDLSNLAFRSHRG